jgi:hypothetical protein
VDRTASKPSFNGLPNPPPKLTDEESKKLFEAEKKTAEGK